jgi:hypothetical protein
MSRIHLFEFNDQAWLPDFMTAWMTRVLHICHEETEDGKVWAPKLLELIHRSGQSKIVDLCSGGGGPVLQMARVLRNDFGVDVHVTLTDLIPNQQTAREINERGGNVAYVTESVSAIDVPNDLPGIRTAFSGLHHMKPDVAFALLKNAFDNRQSIFLGETTSRNVKALRFYSAAFPYFVQFAKRIEPTLEQKFFTFRLPLLPAMLSWDNIVSCLRTYSMREMRQMTSRLVSDDYHWEIGTLCNSKICLRYPYVMGYPTTVRSNDVSTS